MKRDISGMVLSGFAVLFFIFGLYVLWFGFPSFNISDVDRQIIAQVVMSIIFIGFAILSGWLFSISWSERVD